MEIGKYKIETIESGELLLDGGAMFGVIPKPLWERSSPADEKNRIKLKTRHMLLLSSDKKILIDTGSGKNWSEKFERIYGIDYSQHDLLPALEKVGVKPAEITDVILTHLHFDHIGGAVLFENGKPVPAFPNAIYHVQQRQYEWALNPSDRDKASYFNERFVTLAEEGILKQYSGDYQFDENINLIVVNGHTPSQQLVKVSDSTNTMLYCADLVPLSSHISPPYIMGYDLNPLETLKEKQTILQKAVDENWHLFFEHDPKVAAGTIKIGERGFIFDKTFEVI
ncbi:MAG: MBL fold metallo-hydrolase [Melioribacteraceae bacterium]|nr:MBL fold metallo-hydrolase [Melioribacteraceae bacterium]